MEATGQAQTGLLIIDGGISRERVEGVVSLIETIFRVGSEMQMEQKTIRRALNLAGSIVGVRNTTIQNCTLIGTQTVPTGDDLATNDIK